jgi:acyl-CoA synthetase (NDP forming)/GNAT superfamily N-acetyltransferase
MAMGQVVYPDRWETDVVLLDGGTVHIRPLTRDDAPAIEAFHGRQSRESIYFRYFSPMPKLTPRELERITNVDYVSRMAFVALLGDDIIGIASYDVWPGHNEAEAAFIVDDEQQGRGLATVLVEYLVVAARENGLDALTAQVLPSNRRMVSVFNQVGFDVNSAFAEGVIEVRMELDATSQSAAKIEERERRAEARSMERLLFPSSIAVIGAGRDPDGLGNRVFRNLRAHPFGGAIFPVNPQGAAVDGVRAYTSVTEIVDDIDLAVVAVPAAAVTDVVEQCGAKRVHGLVIISAGFDDVGVDGSSVQQHVVDRALRYGMRVIGPESLGVINTAPEGSVFATFARVDVNAGKVGFLTQSGTLGIAALEHARRNDIGISTFVDIGSRVDVSGNDLLQFWRDDPRTSVVLLYLETFGNPRKFTRIAREMARTKPIVAVKSGRTLAAQRDDPGEGLAAVWPADATVDALLAQSGVIRVETPPEMFTTARVLVSQPVPRGRRVAVVSNSKGATMLAVDACSRYGLELHETVEMTWEAGPDEYGAAVRRALATDEVDSILIVYAPPVHERRTAIGDAVAAAVTDHAATGARAKPLLATFLGDHGATGLTVDGLTIPLFEFPGEAARTLSLVTQYGEWVAQPAGDHISVDETESEMAARLAQAVLAEDPEGRWLDRDEAASLLRAAGFPVAHHRTADGADAAVEAARAIGYPVVLKATGVQRFHRGEEGGVALDLHDDESVRAAYERMVEVLGDAMHPTVVQAMVPPGADVLVAAHQHPSFGGVMSLGVGGVMASTNRDLPTRILPLTDADASRLVELSSVAPLLAAEHTGGAVTDACSAFLARLSTVLDRIPEIADVLLNPLIVGESGVCIVDAWVRLAPYEWDPAPPVRRLT